MNFIKKYLLVIVIATTLIGCGGDPEKNASDVAVAFFDAIYNQKDLNKALTYCSPEFAKQMNKYVTAKHASRHLFNMWFDSVEIDTALGDVSVRRAFKATGKLTVLFTGYRQEKIFKELKNIQLIRKNNVWFVNRVLADPMP